MEKILWCSKVRFGAYWKQTFQLEVYTVRQFAPQDRYKIAEDKHIRENIKTFSMMSSGADRFQRNIICSPVGVCVRYSVCL